MDMVMEQDMYWMAMSDQDIYVDYLGGDYCK